MDNGQDDPPGWASRITTLIFALFIHALFAVLAIVGLLLLHVLVRDWRADDADIVGLFVVGFFGIVLSVIGFGFFWVAYVGAPRFLGGLESKREQYSDEPWMENRQWRARRVIHSAKYTAWFMWFWCIAWWSILGFLWSVNKELIMADLRGPWSIAIPTTMPFVAGAIGLLVAIGLSWKRWRYGDAVLLIDTLPGYLGEKFRGRVQAGLGSRPKGPVTLTLTCGSMRSEQRRGSQGKSTTVWVTDELWSTDDTLQPTQTTLDRGRVTLPVDFELPAGLPESGHILDEPQIVWKIKIAPHSGSDQPLRSEFNVPVFERRE